MPGVQIPLGIGSYTRGVAEQPRTILLNMYPERDVSGADAEQVMRIQRPGCAVHQNLTGTSIRGLCYAQGLLGSLPIAAVGTTLYKFDGTTKTSLGTIANDSNPVQFAITNFGFACLSAGILYFYDTSLHTIAIPDGDTPVSICSMDSYVFIGLSNGKFRWLVPGTIVIDAGKFSTAESMPDRLIALKTLKDEVYMFGADTTEVWQMTGLADPVLAPAQGRQWDIGAMSRDSVQPLDNTLYFVGSDGWVYKNNGEPERVSNASIEERISNRTGNVSALAFKYHGHTFYVLYVPGQGTYAYDVLNGIWCEFSSPQLTYGWLPRVCQQMGSIILLGDSASGKVFKLDASISTDDGQQFTRAVSGIVAFEGGRRRFDSLNVRCGTSKNMDVRFRWHDGPALTFGAYRTNTVTQRQTITRYTRMGAVKPPYATIEISTVSDGIFRISGADANDGRAP